jgi:hypothetical protein
MLIRMLWVASAIFLLAAPAQGADCPVARSGDTIADALEKAPTCAAALKLFEACAYGASIDSMFGGIVTTKCEADFMTKLSSAQRKTYNREKDVCTSKYAKKEGTMYRSFEAFCYAKLARSYAQEHAAGPK